MRILLLTSVKIDGKLLAPGTEVDMDQKGSKASPTAKTPAQAKELIRLGAAKRIPSPPLAPVEPDDPGKEPADKKKNGDENNKIPDA